METLMTDPPAGQPAPAPVVLFWWRNPQLDTDVPRRHGVGWATADGTDHGHHAIPSEHLHLHAHQIQQHLAAHLHPRLGHLQLRPAREQWAELDPAVRILADGGRVVTFDLQTPYGPHAVAAVAVEIRGRGVATLTVLDQQLPPERRPSILAWAETQIRNFPTLTDHDLHNTGWSQKTPSRWQHLHYPDPKLT